MDDQTVAAAFEQALKEIDRAERAFAKAEGIQVLRSERQQVLASQRRLKLVLADSAADLRRHLPAASARTHLKDVLPEARQWLQVATRVVMAVDTEFARTRDPQLRQQVTQLNDAWTAAQRAHDLLLDAARRAR